MISDERLLIIIPCLNEERHLPGLLSQFVKECPDALVVVADGGSSDRSREIVVEAAERHGNVTLMHNPARIQSAGINRAVQLHGQGRKWLLRLDAHCDYPPHYADGLIAAARTHDAASVVVPMVSRGTTCFQRAAAAAQNSVLGTGGSPHRHVGQGRFVEHGHHALMQLELFLEVGGYREDMSHNEDAELDLRLAQAGGRIWLEPLALTYYPRSSPKGLWRQYFGYGRGRARTVQLHGQRLRLRQMLPLAVPLAAASALLSPLNLWFAAPLLLWAGIVLCAGVLVGIRAGGGCALISGIPAMISHFAWGTGFISAIIKDAGARR